MIGKIWFFSLMLFVASQPLDENVPAALNKLKELTKGGLNKIKNAELSVVGARDSFIQVAEDRLECILGEYLTQTKAVTLTVKEAVFKGMLKNKQFSNFQCISSASAETLKKLNSINSPVLKTYEDMREAKLEEVHSFKLVLYKLNDYTQDLYQKKHEEIEKSQKPDLIDKILAEVEGKMKQMTNIVDQINTFVSQSKFKFFENLIDFVHKTETDLRKAQKDGNQKIMFCVF